MSNDNRVALISGSTQGIGKEISRRFVQDGWKVIQNSRSLIPKLDIIGSQHITADVTNLKECVFLVESVLKEFGSIDALVCNVGSGLNVGLEFSSTERWEHYLNANLNSASSLISAALDALLESKGSVTAISSICSLAAIEGAPIEYSAAKAALNSYFKSLAIKHAISGVRFNIVAPGNVIFPGSTWDQKLKIDSAGTNSYISANVPMGGFVNPEEIAAAVAFLASKESNSTTGAVLVIDRGQTI